MTPLEQDTAAQAAAEANGLDVVHLPERVVIDNEALVPANLKRLQPDKAKIRKALLEGQQVPGARLADNAWLLIPRKEESSNIQTGVEAGHASVQHSHSDAGS